MHLVEPTRMGALSMTQHNAALVRALFSQFCNAVGHAATATGTVHCPADFGISYSGAFYDGSRALAKFVYLRPVMSLASIADGLRFMEPRLLSRYIDGLRLAGGSAIFGWRSLLRE